jgi:hypothetical protein
MWRVDGGGGEGGYGGFLEARVCVWGVGGGERERRGVVGGKSAHTHLPVSQGAVLPQLAVPNRGSSTPAYHVGSFCHSSP